MSRWILCSYVRIATGRVQLIMMHDSASDLVCSSPHMQVMFDDEPQLAVTQGTYTRLLTTSIRMTTQDSLTAHSGSCEKSLARRVRSPTRKLRCIMSSDPALTKGQVPPERPTPVVLEPMARFDRREGQSETERYGESRTGWLGIFEMSSRRRRHRADVPAPARMYA